MKITIHTHQIETYPRFIFRKQNTASVTATPTTYNTHSISFEALVPEGNESQVIFWMGIRVKK